MNSKKLKKGFTLVELLAVMAIIGVLMLIAVPRFQSMTDGATKTALRANHEIVTGAVQMFYADNNRYPDNYPELVSSNYLNDLTSTAAVATGTTNKSVIPGAVYLVNSDGDILSAVMLKSGSAFIIEYDYSDGTKMEREDTAVPTAIPTT